MIVYMNWLLDVKALILATTGFALSHTAMQFLSAKRELSMVEKLIAMLCVGQGIFVLTKADLLAGK